MAKAQKPCSAAQLALLKALFTHTHGLKRWKHNRTPYIVKWNATSPPTTAQKAQRRGAEEGSALCKCPLQGRQPGDSWWRPFWFPRSTPRVFWSQRRPCANACDVLKTCASSIRWQGQRHKIKRSRFFCRLTKHLLGENGILQTAPRLVTQRYCFNLEWSKHCRVSSALRNATWARVSHFIWLGPLTARLARFRALIRARLWLHRALLARLLGSWA